VSPSKALTCPHVTDNHANKSLTNDQEAGFHTRNLASDLLFRVGVAGFEPTASSSRTWWIRVEQLVRRPSCVVSLVVHAGPCWPVSSCDGGLLTFC
jgi:hypothetical protein